MPHSKTQYISTQDLARFLGITRDAILKRIKTGQVKAVKIGRSFAIPYAYLKEHYPEYKISLLEEGEYLSIVEAAQLLGLTRMAVHKRIKSGKLKAQKAGKRYVISRDQILQTQKENVVQHPLIKECLSIPELAQIMGCSRIYIFKQVQKGIIKAVKVGRHYVIAREDIPIKSLASKETKVIPEEYLSVLDVAQMWGISRIAVFNKIKRGQIKAIKIGRSYAIDRRDIC